MTRLSTLEPRLTMAEAEQIFIHLQEARRHFLLLPSSPRRCRCWAGWVLVLRSLHPARVM